VCTLMMERLEATELIAQSSSPNPTHDHATSNPDRWFLTTSSSRARATKTDAAGSGAKDPACAAHSSLCQLDPHVPIAKR